MTENQSIQRHDFIELDYTGKLPDGKIFDTTQETVAKEAQILSEKMKYFPAKICVGEGQVLPGLDEALVGKEVGKKYTITLPPEKAFGKRDVKKMKIVPTSTFQEHKVQPYPGLQIDVDGEIGTVTRIAGGRIMVNFNHPLAGREVNYEFIIHRKITEKREQVAAFVHRAFGIPEEQIGVELQSEGTEQAVVVSLPFDFPGQLSVVFAKKLAEVMQVKTVEFRKK